MWWKISASILHLTHSFHTSGICDFSISTLDHLKYVCD